MSQRKKIGIVIAAVAAVVAALLIFMAVSVNSAVENDKILKNVFIDRVNVGGMTTKEAQDVLEEHLGQVEQKKITLKAE